MKKLALLVLLLIAINTKAQNPNWIDNLIASYSTQPNAIVKNSVIIAVLQGIKANPDTLGFSQKVDSGEISNDTLILFHNGIAVNIGKVNGSSGSIDTIGLSNRINLKPDSVKMAETINTDIETGDTLSFTGTIRYYIGGTSHVGGTFTVPWQTWKYILSSYYTKTQTDSAIAATGITPAGSFQDIQINSGSGTFFADGTGKLYNGLLTISGTGTTSGWGNTNVIVQNSGSEAGISLNNTGAGGNSWNLISTSNGSGIGGHAFSIGNASSGVSFLQFDSVGNILLGQTNNNNSQLSTNNSTGVLQYYSNDPYFLIDGINRNGGMGDLSNDWSNTRINWDDAAQTITLNANNGVQCNNTHVYFGSGGQNISKGTFDNGTSGNNGISLNCAIGYELNWQGGHLTASYNNGANFIPLQVDSGLAVRGMAGSPTATFMNGNVGIGTTQPTSKLTVNSNTSNITYIQTDNAPVLNDATYSGTIIYPSLPEVIVFTVTIQFSGSPDNFEWTEAGGSNASSGLGGVNIDGSVQSLADGISIQFGSITGHNFGDQWIYTITPTTPSPLNIAINSSTVLRVDSLGQLNLSDVPLGNSTNNILQIDGAGKVLQIPIDSIPPSGLTLITGTYAQIDTLVVHKQIQTGFQYLVTDANYCDNGAVLTGVDSSNLSLQGSGGFLNPDFQSLGDYSGVFSLTGVAYDSTRGIWDENLQYLWLQGDVVFWNGLHYQLTTISDTTADNPSVNTAAWTLLPKNVANMGYILEWDNIELNWDKNWLQYRADKRGNTFQYTTGADSVWYGLGHSGIPEFQWGNNKAFANYIFESRVQAINLLCTFYDNFLVSYWFYGNYFGVGSTFNQNYMTHNGFISNTIGDSTIMANNFVMIDINFEGNSLGNHVSWTGNTFFSTNLTSLVGYNTWSDSSQFEQNTINSTDFVGNQFDVGSIFSFNSAIPDLLVHVNAYDTVTYNTFQRNYTGTFSSSVSYRVFDNQIQINDGTEGAGKVLTSDANGLASWQASSGGSGWLLTGNNTTGTNAVFGTINDSGLVLIAGNEIVGYFTNGDSTGIFLSFSGETAGDGNTGNNVNAFGYLSATSNSGSNIDAYGTSAANQDSGSYVDAYGLSTAVSNKGSFVDAYGQNAADGNTGNLVDAYGNGAADNNTGNNIYAYGDDAAAVNTGSTVNAFGANTLQNNSGNHANAFGQNAGSNNTNNYVNLLGENSFALRDSCTIIGDSTVNKYVGIGTGYPTSLLHLKGSLTIQDGTQGLGKVFVSDANGLGSWNPSTLSGTDTLVSTSNLEANYVQIVDSNINGGYATPAYVLAHAGAGTVTNVSVVTANGFSGTVATSTTTPAITISQSSIASSTTATTQSANDNSTKIATTAYVVTAIANVPILVARADSTAQTGADANVTSFTTSAIGTYRVGGYVTITAIATNTINFKVSYTDENSNAQTLTFFPQGLTSAALATTGAFAFPTMDIRVKSGVAITILTTVTGIGTQTYDAGATITKLY